MKSVLRAGVYLVCLPADCAGLLVAWLVTLGSRPVWRWRGRILSVTPPRTSWIGKHWRYSTTFGHVVLLAPGYSPHTVSHELAHVVQFEAVCVGWAVGSMPIAIFWPAVAAALAPFAWLLFYMALAGWTALRGRHWYLDHPLEVQARRIADEGEISPEDDTLDLGPRDG